MKPLVLFFSFFAAQNCLAQSLDYVSVRKKNGRVVKNFYAGSDVLLQTTDGAYLQGPVKTVRNDTVFLTLYDVRSVPTIYGGYRRDTLTASILGVHYKDIKRIHLGRRSNFYRRNGPSLLMLGGGGYFALNVLNGTFFTESIHSSDKVKRLGISAGVFFLGYFLKKLLQSDGFSRSSQQIVYVNLSPKKA